MNLTDEILRNVLPMDWRNAGFALLVCTKCSLAIARLLVHAREITARHPMSRQKFNRHADFIHFFGDRPRPLIPPR